MVTGQNCGIFTLFSLLCHTTGPEGSVQLSLLLKINTQADIHTHTQNTYTHKTHTHIHAFSIISDDCSFSDVTVSDCLLTISRVKSDEAYVPHHIYWVYVMNS